jgi:hypothetical protein
MELMFCPRCRLQQPMSHSFCVACGEKLPAQLLRQRPSKSSRFFAGVKVDPGDPENAYLRVSCYREDRTISSPEGSVVVPGHHVRFSVWINGEARCVLSIPENEGRDLAGFIGSGLAPDDQGSWPGSISATS